MAIDGEPWRQVPASQIGLTSEDGGAYEARNAVHDADGVDGPGVRPAPPSSSSVKNAQERPERGADIRKPLTTRDAVASGDSGRDFDERAFLELARTVPANRTPLRRNIRRAELRQLVPLADTTIYEMERRGEFPHRFWLTERCVVWDLAEVEAWIEARRKVGVTGSMTKMAKPDVRQRRSRPVGDNL